MGNGKKLGVWMCHNSIHLIECSDDIHGLKQTSDGDEVHQILAHEAALQNEAYHQQTQSFKKVADSIQRYEEVVLFGPVDSKLEFLKFLESDKRFENIQISVKQTQVMSEDQQESFVEKFFYQAAANPNKLVP
jgi:hypothetical protein